MTGPPFWGKYRGTVTDTTDPISLGRVQVQVPDVYGDDDSGWAMPCAPYGGDSTGLFAVPPVGAGVWVEFEHGDPDYPIWTGCWWGSATERPPTLAALPDRQFVVQTPQGNTLTLSDVPGIGGITLQTDTGAKIQIGATGIVIDNGQGATISLTGPSVSVNNGAIEVI